MMKWLTNFSMRNPVAIVLLVVLIAVGGVYSATKFNQEMLPEVSMPGVFVSAVYPGASPNEVLDDVSRPIEQAVRNVDGVKNVITHSANSFASVQVEFSFSDDMKEKRALVEEALSGVALPASVEKPSVQIFSTSSDPIVMSSWFAKDGVSQAAFTEKLKNQVIPELESLEGVYEVRTYGLEDDGVYIYLDAPSMNEHGISFDDVQMALQLNNMNAPLGEITLGLENVPVFVQGRIDSVEALGELVVSPMTGVKLKEIASIEQGKEQALISLTNGIPSVNIDIYKTSAANTVAVSDEVMELIERFEQEGELETFIIWDQSIEIKESVHSLTREGLLGALFASIMILFFLRNFRATIIAIVSIPLSMLITLVVLKSFTDVTLNILSLGGLAVAIGRVVDDSIVVIENIVRRLQKEKGSQRLILDGVLEVGKAITSSTLTTVAVFAPLAFLQGMSGEFARPLAITVSVALLSSLLVALTVVPLMAWVLMRNYKPKQRKELAMSRGYKKVLRWSLNHKFVVLLISGLLFFSSFIPMATGAIGVTFLPETEYKYMFATINMPNGTSLEAVKNEAEPIDRIFREHEQVQNTQMLLNSGTGGGSKGSWAEWFVSLKSDTDTAAVIEELREKIKVSDTVEFSLMNHNGEGSNRVAITVTGNNMDQIREGANLIIEELESIEGMSRINSNLESGTTGVAIQVRQEDAASYGLSAAQAAQMIYPYLTETPAGNIQMDGRTNELYLALSGDSLSSHEHIANMHLSTPFGTDIIVSDIADVRYVQLPGAIELKNGVEYVTVTAMIEADNAASVNREMVKQLAALDLPNGVEYSIGGSNEEDAEMMSDMLLAMVAAVGFVYIVMVITFREGRVPFAVLFSLPFALIGGIVGTLVANEPISISSMIGFLMLIGIVVTNAIVFVERVQQQIDKGLTIREALVEAGGTRLRPILMTAIATICALLPLALGLGGSGGSIISGGLAVVVIGGLTSSTLLTLVVVPVMYELLYFKRSRKEREGLLTPQKHSEAEDEDGTSAVTNVPATT